MGIEIKKDSYGNLSVETDYGFGDMDHERVYSNRAMITNHMEKSDKTSLKGDKYFDVMMDIKRERARLEEVMRKAADECGKDTYRVGSQVFF